MGLVSAKEMLDKAKAGHYAVGQFNINNLEWTKSILLTAEELKAPVILGVSEGAAKYMTGFKTVSAMVSAMVDSLGITVPVALHLDHGSYEGAKAALEAGFSSIMFDGSHYGIEEKAITLGVSKINVNTECQLYFQEATRKYIEAGKDLEGKGFDPRKLLAPGAAAIQECVKEKMELFGCIGKA